MSEEKQKKPFYKKWWVWLIAGILFIGALSGNGGENEPSKPDQPVTASTNQGSDAKPETKNDSKFIKAGMYKVGTDLPAGEYLLYPERMAYFQVSKDSSGSLESIISNDNFSGTRYVTVSDGQYLEVRGAKMLPAAEAEPQQAKDNIYSAGMYKVGKDIAPGEYKAVSTGGMAYLEVTKNSAHGLESIVSNDNFEGEKYITIGENQYIKLNGCELKK